MAMIPRVLTIAGSDSGGCAGIQADLKTFAALGVHGMSVITSVTAQDTQRVFLATELPLRNIETQIRAVIEDIGADAVKTGMLPSAEVICLVARKMKQYGIERLVTDPVMLSTNGDPLIEEEAVEVLKKELFPLSLVVTPNLREAERLTGRQITDEKAMQEAAREIHALGPRSVIIKGGHFNDALLSTDWLFDGEGFTPFSSTRFDTTNTHGSGCTFASAIAAHLARGSTLKEAVAGAKTYVTEAIRHSFPLGRGHGPLGHFHRFWKD